MPYRFPAALARSAAHVDTASMSRLHLRAARVLVAGAACLDSLPEATVVVENGRIVGVEPGRIAGEGVDLPQDGVLAPGLVDLQVNGGGGLLYNDSPTAAAALAIARAHRDLGVTTILPTLITDLPARMREAAGSIAAAVAATEELEETARLHLMLRGLNPRLLDRAQVEDLERHFSLEPFLDHDHGDSQPHG